MAGGAVVYIAATLGLALTGVTAPGSIRPQDPALGQGQRERGVVDRVQRRVLRRPGHHEGAAAVAVSAARAAGAPSDPREILEAALAYTPDGETRAGIAEAFEAEVFRPAADRSLDPIEEIFAVLDLYRQQIVDGGFAFAIPAHQLGAQRVESVEAGPPVGRAGPGAGAGPPEPGAEPSANEESLNLQKLAFEVCVRINRATPITPISLVALGLLGRGDRALSVEEAIGALRNLVSYVSKRRLTTTQELDLDTPDGMRRTLDQLVDNGVLTRFDFGTSIVYGAIGINLTLGIDVKVAVSRLPTALQFFGGRTHPDVFLAFIHFRNRDGIQRNLSDRRLFSVLCPCDNLPTVCFPGEKK